MNLLNDDMVSKLAVNIFTEVFKSVYIERKWLFGFVKKRAKKYDFLGRAAKRYAARMEERFNYVRVIGMNEPMPLRGIYVRVNILKKITNRQSSTISDLERAFDKDKRRFGDSEGNMSGNDVVDAFDKFIVLGKPGAGKSTYLKYLILHALDGELEQNRVPVFIGLKDYADSNDFVNPNVDYILQAIYKEFDICNISKSEELVRKILVNGKFIILLDGLDEVEKSKESQVIRSIIDFSDKYSTNKYVISCRVASYNHWFQTFRDVEIADFNEEQIVSFVKNWFRDEGVLGQEFENKLRDNPQIFELANIPLLLTLLCIVFNENYDFPLNRSELYSEALDALLRKWDASRRIKRDNFYKNLSPKWKEMLLSHVANVTFNENNYFIKKTELVDLVSDFIKDLPNKTDSQLAVDSEGIIKSIEAQHGILVERAKSIYSFSHLTFQEYYKAKYLVDHLDEGVLERLIEEQIDNDRWREVFLLTTEMLNKKADRFLTLIRSSIENKLEPSVKQFLNTILELRYIKSDYIPNNLLILNVLHVIRSRSDRSRRIIKQQALEGITEYLLDSYKGSLDMSVSGVNRFLETKKFETFLREVDYQVTIDGDIKNVLHLLNEFLSMNLLLVDCLKTDCYLSNGVKASLSNSIMDLQFNLDEGK